MEDKLIAQLCNRLQITKDDYCEMLFSYGLEYYEQKYEKHNDYELLSKAYLSKKFWKHAQDIMLLDSEEYKEYSKTEYYPKKQRIYLFIEYVLASSKMKLERVIDINNDVKKVLKNLKNKSYV
ncbi:hypothetical protein [Flavobacterium psychrophilum]|uniref:hypothetical protein n=1 Tax=Flavobacterium psychrophilum TaxID=96345 RepID=UPI0010698A42|nr:hypothetical protein [Flavobacterium psychrophilum]